MNCKILNILLVVLIASVSAFAQAKGPKTVRDYFMLLPGKYFSLDCCMMEKTPKAAKEKYLKTYLDVEDTANGYMKGGGDGAQEAFEMALFKRPDGSYLVGFYTVGEGGPEDVPYTRFLRYSGGRWTDVSKTVVANYDPVKRIYEVPREGTTVQVFEKDEAGDWYKGKKLHDLEWKNGTFTVKK